MTRLWENAAGTELLPVAQTEVMHGTVLVSLVRERASAGSYVTLRMGDDHGWRPLDFPDGEDPVRQAMAALRCCTRCRRLNFGPCISATCTDLQVARPCC